MFKSKESKIWFKMIVAIVMCLAIVTTAPADTTWVQQVKLLASDGVAGDDLGRSVVNQGDYALVGAPFDDDNGTDSGSVYIFKRDGENWTQQTKITASDNNAGDWFGWTASIHGEYAIIGAYHDDANGMESGKAYIFKRNGTSWTEQTRLFAPDGFMLQRFGISVSINGDYAIVGAQGDNSFTGAAYIFLRDIDGFWTPGPKLTASDGASQDWFGNSVSISGDYVILGAPGNNEKAFDAGAAYIFKRTDMYTWTELTKLTATDAATGDKFGRSVWISGDYCLIGAIYNDANGTGSGSAYMFKRNPNTDTWSQQAKLTASDGAQSDHFGYSVSIDDNYAIVGAIASDANATDSGSAYIFKRNGTNWMEHIKLSAPDGQVNDWFGISVCISGEYVIAGANGNDDNGAQSGSAYMFKRELKCADWLTADLDGDCFVDFADFAIMAGQWLLSGE